MRRENLWVSRIYFMYGCVVLAAMLSFIPIILRSYCEHTRAVLILVNDMNVLLLLFRNRHPLLALRGVPAFPCQGIV